MGTADIELDDGGEDSMPWVFRGFPHFPGDRDATVIVGAQRARCFVLPRVLLEL